MILDTFMFSTELDMLECRLRELEQIPDLVHIAVEADVDHQDHPKPYVLSENLDRFDQWKDRLHVVRATGLPTAADNPDPWAREFAQREWVAHGLRDLDVTDDTVVLHGDVDEIPTRTFVANVRPAQVVCAGQTFHPFAVDWLHPDEWIGTVAAPAGQIKTFAGLRDVATQARMNPAGFQVIHRAGWHFSWVGGHDYCLDKLTAFCHPEIADRTLAGLQQDVFYREGLHVDGKRLEPVDVDRRWPRWVRDRECPADWFRPRG